MRVGLFAVGRLKAGPEKELAARYLDRFAKAGPAIGLEFSRLSEVNESRASSADTRKREEAGMLEKAVPEGSLLLLLDERGKALDSQGFATLLGSFRDMGKRDLMIAIGGADGLDPSLLAAAHGKLAFGPQTWPHALARAMLAEQVYRAVTILAGGPYHRD